ncbi:Qat anti-phage system TatD family nuclease QatD [Dechloromonas denitrificans]|uniref:Qat anti-phage system TatD family nuclease QatD n=1 Tax=Dechloromonas denitrificans TaxID=281362 RepID=UPI001CF8DC1E|nr:Qat anti-phage system TatD family nuclease QatD [Dechloromonas denitrificans]UCV05694.1 TatD family hydrolase [Dechloromonas denitrificans]
MIDFHAHLDLYPDPGMIVREVAARGMYVLSVTTTPSAWKGTSALVTPGSRIRTALGLHPQLAHLRVSELQLFDAYLHESMYVGEIGLDGAPEFKQHWETQIAIFDHILNACGSAGGRIMSIHSRRAAPTVLDRLEAFPDAGTPVLHWFSGSKRDLRRAIARGCWFSVGPAMLVAEKACDLVRNMPRDRVLTETDGPFAQINGKSAVPWDAYKATVRLAEIWGTSVSEAEQLLHSNLRRLVELGTVGQADTSPN